MVEPENEPDAQRPRPRPFDAAHRADPDVEPEPGGEDGTDADQDAEQDIDSAGPDADPGHDSEDDPAVARLRRARNRAGLLAALVVMVAVIVAVVLIVRHGSSGSSGDAGTAADQDAASVTDSGAADAFVAGATGDIAAVTTYDYRSLDTALSNGESVTTGAYRASFRAALTGPLAAEATRVRRTQAFTLSAAGIGEIAKNGTSAKVLVFGIQSVMDATTAGRARQTVVTLLATVDRQDNRYLLADLSAGQNAGLPAGSAGLRAAAEAGRAEVAAVLTLRHDHFDADYNASLAGAVEPLRTMLTSQAAAARQRVVRGGYDLVGTVTAVAVQRASGDTLVLLAAATGTRTLAGKTSVVVDGRYRVTVVRVGGRWVTSAIDAVTPA